MKKKLIGIVCIVIVVAVAIVIGIVLNKNNSTENGGNTGNGGSTVNNGKLYKVSFNNIKIGDKIKKEMKNLVLDAYHKYEYNNIEMNVDKDDKITYLGFHTSTDTEGNYVDKYSDITVKYEDKKLSTISDFKEYLGEGEASEIEKTYDNKDSYYITYNYDDLTLKLYIRDNMIYNINLEKIKSN